MVAADFLGTSRRLGLARRDMALVVGLGLAQALCEAGAVMLLLPGLQFIQAGGDVARLTAQHAPWRGIVAVFGALGIPVSLASILMLAFAAVLARQAMQFLQRTVTARKRWQVVAGIKHRLFATFLAADLGSVEHEGTGRMLAEFTSETETAATALFYSLQVLVLAGIVAVYLAGLLMMSAPLTALAMAIMSGTALLLRPLIRRSLKIGAEVSAANQDVGGFLVERLRQLRLVRLAGMEAPEAGAAERLLLRQRDGQVAGESLSARLAATIEPIFIGFAFFCLWFGASKLGLGLELLGIFLVIVLRLVPIGKDLMGARQIILQTSPALSLVDQTIARLSAAREPGGGTRTLPARAPEIRLERVAFTYGGERAALDGIDLTLPAGQITALVGPSGAGKSTLVDLLPRLRVAQSGRVTFDGVDARDLDLASLRTGIAYVPQQAQVFDGTIAAHVRYGRADATDREVEAALALAQCDFVAALSDKMNTRIGEGGGRLSGGQRQRLDLARALVRRAPVLILDEPTSALDAENERLFLAAIAEVRRTLAPTMLIIAHRLSSIAGADQIAVMEAGKIIECGTHAALLARGGWYARAWTTQTANAA